LIRVGLFSSIGTVMSPVLELTDAGLEGSGLVFTGMVGSPGYAPIEM
jgi:hypothetical protein